MYALRIGANAYVREYRYCTLARFASETTFNKTADSDGLYWVWVDRTAFWSEDEHQAFVQNYLNYFYKPTLKEVWPTYVKPTSPAS